MQQSSDQDLPRHALGAVCLRDCNNRYNKNVNHILNRISIAMYYVYTGNIDELFGIYMVYDKRILANPLIRSAHFQCETQSLVFETEIELKCI